jgi:hypothetical protein
MLVETPGMMAPAVTATKPAINAYSIRSWPQVSRKLRNKRSTLTVHRKTISVESALGKVAQRRCSLLRFCGIN